MTPWPMAVGVAAPIAGRLSDRVPAAILGFVGLSGLAIGMVLLARLPLTASFVDIAWPMACAARASASSRRPTTARCCLRRRAGAPGRRAACWRPRG